MHQIYGNGAQMSEKTIKLVVSYGQSLSVGSEGVGALSTEAQFSENALMLKYADQQYQYDDWGAIGPKGGVFDPRLVSGFTPLLNYRTESHTTAMINTIIWEYQNAGEALPTILNISSGSPGKSIQYLSDRTEVAYQNLVGQIEAAYIVAEAEGYKIDPEIIFYWKQGSANSNMYHVSYAEALGELLGKIQFDSSMIIGEDSSIKFFNDISGRRGSAWGNLDFVLSTNDSYLAGESQWDTGVPNVGGVFNGAYGGHKSNSAYFIQGSEAGNVIADALLGRSSENEIILMSGVEVYDNIAVVTFSGLEGHLVVDDLHSSYFRDNNAVDLGFFAYADSGKYTGAHVYGNAVTQAEIVDDNKVKVTFERKIEKNFYLGVGGGDGGVGLNATPLRDSVTSAVINYVDDPSIEMFNDELGGIKKYVTYHYVKIGPSGMVKSAYDIAGAEEPVVFPDTGTEDIEDAAFLAGMELGKVAISQDGSDQWHSVSFSQVIQDARVVAGPLSFNGFQETTIRLRNVTDTGFEFQIDEWDYLDGRHISETFSWMAISEGTFRLADGTLVGAGRTMVEGVISQRVDLVGFDSVDVFSFAQITSANESSAAITRIDKVDSSGFDVTIQEEEASDGFHASEMVDWIVFEASSGTMGTIEMAIDHRWGTRSNIDALSERDALIAGMQTINGGDPATLRYVTDWRGTQLSVAEETSADDESWHREEDVGIVLLEVGAYELF